MATDRAPKGLDRARLAGAYVGSVLGAGFASGQEHAAFFLKFGAEGFLALGVAGSMFAVFGAWLLAPRPPVPDLLTHPSVGSDRSSAPRHPL